MCRITLSLVEAGSGGMPSSIVATAASLAGVSSLLSASGIAGFALNGIVGQSPLSLGSAFAAIGMPSQGVAGLVSGLATGSVGPVAQSLSSSFGLSLPQGIPARLAGSVLQMPTISTLTSALSR